MEEVFLSKHLSMTKRVNTKLSLILTTTLLLVQRELVMDTKSELKGMKARTKKEKQNSMFSEMQPSMRLGQRSLVMLTILIQMNKPSKTDFPATCHKK